MGFDTKKQLALRYLFLSQDDRQIIEKSLPDTVIQELKGIVSDLEGRGIIVENLNRMDYSLVARELKVSAPNDAYKYVLFMIENKAVLLNKSEPKKLVKAINSLLI